MRVRPKNTVLTGRPARRRHEPRDPAAPPAPAPEAAEHPHEQRARESGGPIDRASYACGCGLVFEAPVSTTVGCPNCGDLQAW
jgi:hypothetical protein